MAEDRNAEDSDIGAEFDSDFEAWFTTRGVYAGYSFATKRWMMMQAINERSAFDAGVAAGAASRASPGERLPAWLDEFLPFQGPCALCGGPDARHRRLDSACENVRAGDPLEAVARSFELPAHVIARAITEGLDRG